MHWVHLAHQDLCLEGTGLWGWQGGLSISTDTGRDGDTVWWHHHVCASQPVPESLSYPAPWGRFLPCESLP